MPTSRFKQESIGKVSFNYYLFYFQIDPRVNGQGQICIKSVYGI